MSSLEELKRRIEIIEAGYEYLLAYAAQGRQNEQGSDVRRTLTDMHGALDGLGEVVDTAVGIAAAAADARHFLDAVASDARVARAAIALVLGREKIGSLLVDNLNASVHLRALLTDLFLIEQALKSAPAG